MRLTRTVRTASEQETTEKKQTKRKAVISRAGSGPADDASVNSMDLGTDYCYAGVLLALLWSPTQGVRRVVGDMWLLA